MKERERERDQGEEIRREIRKPKMQIWDLCFKSMENSTNGSSQDLRKT